MLVSSVNFAGAAGTSFQDKLKQPQAFVRPDAPMASTGINNDDEGKSKWGKRAAIALGTAAVAAAGLGLGKKYNVFAPGENVKLNTVKEYLDKGGEKVLDAVGWTLNKLKSAKDTVVGFFKKDGGEGAGAGNAATGAQGTN